MLVITVFFSHVCLAHESSEGCLYHKTMRQDVLKAHVAHLYLSLHISKEDKLTQSLVFCSGESELEYIYICIYSINNMKLKYTYGFPLAFFFKQKHNFIQFK